MKLDLSHPDTYWKHKQYASGSYTWMPAVVLGAIALSVVLMFFS